MGVLEAETLRSGPLDPEVAAGLPAPPLVRMAPLPQLLRFNQRQIEFVFRARRELGDDALVAGFLDAGSHASRLPR